MRKSIPSARRCYRLGMALRKAIESYPEDIKVAIVGTGGLSHQVQGERAGFNNTPWDMEFMELLEKDPEALTHITIAEYAKRGGIEGAEVIMWLIMTGFPQLHAQTIESATHFATAPMSAQTLSLAVLGGMTITLMTRMQHGTDSMTGKIAAAVATAFLLAGLQMFHSILDSLLIFGALATGVAPFGYLDWLGWFGYTVTGNVLGGLVFVTLLRVLRSKERFEQERTAAEASGANH